MAYRAYQSGDASWLYTTPWLSYNICPRSGEHGVLNVPGYYSHINIGASIRGTIILARGTLHLTNITNFPSGRAIDAFVKWIGLINVYAPSGTSRWADRKQFYTSELPYLFHDAHSDRLLRWFQLRINPKDTKDNLNTARPSRRWSTN
jgi:hypothetical protein